MGYKAVITPEIAEYITKNAAGHTVRELADELGINYQTVYAYAKKRGLPVIRDKIGPRGGKWAGCEKTCPDFCPYPECRMPASHAVKGYEDEFLLREFCEYGRKHDGE